MSVTLQRFGLGVLGGARTFRRAGIPSRRWSSTLTNILADDNPPPVLVDSMTDRAIHLQDGRVIVGPCIFLRGEVLKWDVPETPWKDWSMDHFKAFEDVEHKPEILIVGTGSRIVPLPPKLREKIRELGIGMDISDTRSACSTYNVLAEEGRPVAAALFPIKPKVTG